jgi:hypothetical protein
MLDINGFMSQISSADGFARQNRYDVVIPATLLGITSTKIYNAVKALNEDAATDWMDEFYAVDLAQTAFQLQAFCEKSELPSYQFQLETVRHYGPSFKIPHMPEYQDLTMTFMCGSEMWERYFFDAWMYLVMDPYTNDFNYKSEYALNIDIIQYNEGATSSDIDFTSAGETLAPSLGKTNLETSTTYNVDYNYYTTLIDAFPIAINTQELGYDNNNSIQKVQVTFSFKSAIPFEGKGSTTAAEARGQRTQFRQSITAKSQ